MPNLLCLSLFTIPIRLKSSSHFCGVKWEYGHTSIHIQKSNPLLNRKKNCNDNGTLFQISLLRKLMAKQEMS